MRSALKKFGNSSGVLIPKPLLLESGLAAGDSVELTVETGRIVIERVASEPRAGWAEDAARLAGADDAPVWPEFSNEADETLSW